MSWKELGQVFRETFIEFFREKNFIHAAALSYYTVLTIVPIIYLSIVTFGKFIGQETMVSIITKFFTENIGIKDVGGIIEFLNQYNFEKGSLFMQVIGLLFLLFSASAQFSCMKHSINEYFDIERILDSRKKIVISNLSTRLVSMMFLTFFGVISILTYFAQTVLISFGHHLLDNRDTLHWFYSLFAQHGLAIFSNVILFLFIFKYLNDAKVEWRLAWIGSVFTSVLLYLGQLLIKYYLTHYFFARDGGIAGTILVILVWMFYSSHIIFLGAKFTAVYARKLGRPLQID